MSHRYPLLILVTAVIVLVTAYANYMEFKPSGLPFATELVDAHTASVQPVTGIPLPAGLQPGSRIDLEASDRAARVALLPNILAESNLSANGSYDFMLTSNNTVSRVSVNNVAAGTASGLQLLSWLVVLVDLLYAATSLLLLWRGRDRTSAYMTLWIVPIWLGAELTSIPAAGGTLLAFQLISTILYLLARVGFYFTVESLLASALAPNRRTLFRSTFLLVLLASAVQQFGGVLIFVMVGWAELLRPAYGLVFSASYLVPTLMLIVNYGASHAAQRLRLRWVLWGSVVYVIGIFLSNTRLPFLGQIATNTIYVCAYLIGLGCILYAVLRHRVVNVSVVADRTLVYGSVTALVVGVLAAVNTVAQHAALGTNASLLLQIIVPLALGIVLSQVRNYADKIVERVFFRRKYLAEKALRQFARHAARYERVDHLLDATVHETRTRVGAHGVAIYERGAGGYAAIRQEGEVIYPRQLSMDDAACVAARSGNRSTDLTELHSRLGTDGYVLPMMADGELQAILVCANRPGEHYTADERKLLAYVARHLGAALYSLRMRAQAQFVSELSNGALQVAPEIQNKARALTSAAVG